MGRRYRRRKSNSIISIVPDIVYIASRLPWWGALLTGIIAYILIAVLLGGYLESHLASQEGSHLYVILEARFGRMIQVFNWVGIACLIAGLFFAIRNYFVARHARRNEKSIVTILSKLLGRSLD